MVNVTPAPNNGTDGVLYDILRAPPPLPEITGGNDYSLPVYPTDDEVYEERANLTGTGCQCNAQVWRTVQS